jgi:AcrR family transcriptional regulator
VTLRADAQRNLDRLLDAAAEVFAEQGCDASVDEIARRAGVGHGTVFRRFPTKDALLGAVLGERLRVLTAAADDALADPDAGAAFERFFRYAAEEYGRNRALEGLDRCRSTREAETFYTAVAQLVERAQHAGALREDVSAKDVLLLIPTASRYPDVIFSGLRRASVSV